MKKGRPAVTLSALCEPVAAPRVRDAFFRATSTLGVRSYAVSRSELSRSTDTVTVRGMPIKVKVAIQSGGPLTVKPEHDDVRAVAEATGTPVRVVAEEAQAAARAKISERAE